MKSAIKRMMGIGMPMNHNKSDRITFSFLNANLNIGRAIKPSRRRPPKVAAQLAVKAPFRDVATLQCGFT